MILTWSIPRMPTATASASFSRVIGARSFFQFNAETVLDQGLYPGHWNSGSQPHAKSPHKSDDPTCTRRVNVFFPI